MSQLCGRPREKCVVRPTLPPSDALFSKSPQAGTLHDNAHFGVIRPLASTCHGLPMFVPRRPGGGALEEAAGIEPASVGA